MTPDQIIGILLLLADLRSQLGAALTENQALKAHINELQSKEFVDLDSESMSS